MQNLTDAPAKPREVDGYSSRGSGFWFRNGATAEIRRRVGAALDMNPDVIEVDRTCLSRSGSAMRCSGRIGKKRFSAKTYLFDQYQFPSLFVLPGEELHRPEEVFRPIEEQITIEWKGIHQMRSVVGSRNCPTPLGYTLEGRTLVFEEVSGMGVDRLTRRAWPWKVRLKSAEAALFHAGAWLRNLHQSSSRKWETVFPIEVLQQGRRMFDLRTAESAYHERLSLQALEAACRQIGPRTPIRVSVSMNLGEFSLQNLLWDGEKEHLWVMDFGLTSYRSTLHDLSTMVYDLRRRLFHPLTSPRVIRRFEQSFWTGYGSIAANLRLLVNAVATYCLFDQSLPSICNAYPRRNFAGRIRSTVYRRLFQPFMISRILRAH